MTTEVLHSTNYTLRGIENSLDGLIQVTSDLKPLDFTDDFEKVADSVDGLAITVKDSFDELNQSLKSATNSALGEHDAQMLQKIEIAIATRLGTELKVEQVCAEIIKNGSAEIWSLNVQLQNKLRQMFPICTTAAAMDTDFCAFTCYGKCRMTLFPDTAAINQHLRSHAIQSRRREWEADNKSDQKKRKFDIENE